jgi:hypothetical protein
LKTSETQDHPSSNGAALLSAKVPRKIFGGVTIALALWLAVVGGATISMTHYSNTPGRSGSVPIVWPRESQIPFDSKRPTLIMFMHPRCPCSRASLGELEQLLTQASAQPSTHVVFLKPIDTAANWEKTDLWRRASSIPGVSVYIDQSGLEAHRFHSETSGQTLFYDVDGNLRFAGGITLARGHSGDNPGLTALQELMRDGHSSEVKTPVFGCALFEARCEKGDSVCKP